MQIDKNKFYNCSPYTRAKGFTQLMLCVLNNDLDTSKKCLSEIDAKNSIEWTALHIACANSATFSSVKMVEFLLRNGADPNVKDNDGWTPLHWVSANSNSASTSSLETIELLLKSGADPNVKDNDGWTPLHWTSKSSARGNTSSLKKVEILLKHGADLKVKDNGGWMPLHVALMYLDSTSSIETIKFLLRNGATPINEETQILKLEVNIESIIEENEKLRQYILMLESEED